MLPQNVAHATIPAKDVTAESSRPWWKWVRPQTDRATTGGTCSSNTQRAPGLRSPLRAWEQPAFCPSDRKTALEMRGLDLVDEADFLAPQRGHVDDVKVLKKGDIYIGPQSGCA